MHSSGTSTANWLSCAVLGVLLGVSGYAGATSDAAAPTQDSVQKAQGEEDIVAMEQTVGQTKGQVVDDAVDSDHAAQDPVAYLLALDTIRAYFWAGQIAYQSNDPGTAGEMFEAPMVDVYVNLESFLNQQGAPPFGKALSEASEAAFLEKSQGDIQAAIDTIFDSLTTAEQVTPKSDRSPEDSQAEVLADLLVRAATQYNAAFEADGTDRTWLNGYGFYKAAQYRASVALPLLSQQKTEIHSAFLKAMELLDQAYKSTARPVIAPIRQSSVTEAAQHAADLVGAH